MTTIDLEKIAAGQMQKGFLTPELGHLVKLPYFVLRGQTHGRLC